MEVTTLPHSAPIKFKVDGEFHNGTIASGVDSAGNVGVVRPSDGYSFSIKFTDIFPISNRELLKAHLKTITTYYQEEQKKMVEQIAANAVMVENISKFKTDEEELLALVGKIKRMKNPGNIIKAVKSWGLFHINIESFMKEYFVNE